MGAHQDDPAVAQRSPHAPGRPMIYALLAAIAVGALVASILIAALKGAQADLVQERADHAKTRTQLLEATAGAKTSEVARGDNDARLEAVIVELKKEIDRLENSASVDPAAVRDRLVGLFGTASGNLPGAPGPGLGTGALGLMPYGSTPKP